RALCALRGSRRRRALPSALGVPAAGHSANPGTRGSRRPSPAAPVPPVRGAPAAPWVPAVPALNSVILDRPRPLYLTYTRSTVIVPTVQPVTERRQALWTTHSLWTTRPPGWRPARRAPRSGGARPAARLARLPRLRHVLRRHRQAPPLGEQPPRAAGRDVQASQHRGHRDAREHVVEQH